MIELVPIAARVRPIIGRESELGRLRAIGGLDGAPSGGAVLIGGDAGIGKSRLVAELAASAKDAGRTVVAGHCVAVGGQALAWLPFVELVAEVAAATSAVDVTTEQHPALAALQPGTIEKVAADPRQMAEAVHALLVAAARERPLLVVIEDVHWADDSSRDLLTVLLTRGFNAPVTLVVTYRSDDLHRRHPLHDVLATWTRLPLLTRLHLQPLRRDQMLQLVRGLDEAPSSSAGVLEVVRRADGNPFFAEELVAGGDAARTTGDLTRLLRVRLDQLDAPARHLVQAASLAGGSVHPDLLGEVTGLDPEALDEALHQSIDHHIIEPCGPSDFRFRHALLGETIAQELLPGARRRLHSAWLTTLRAHPEITASADLARHAAATGDLAAAADAAVAAGDEAMRVGGARDALRLYEAALGWTDDAGRRGEISLAASKAAEAGGDQTRSLGLLEEAIADLDPAQHPRTRAHLLGRAALWHTVLDLPGDPLAQSREAMDLVADERDEEAVEVMLRHLEVLVNLDHKVRTDEDDMDEASALADELRALADTLDLPVVHGEVRMHEARRYSRSDPERAVAGLGATADDPQASVTLRLSAILRMGSMSHTAGDLERAHEHYVRGARMAAENHLTWGSFGMECRLQAGRTAYELGRWDEAEDWLTSPSDLPQPPRGFMECALVELLVARGDDVDPGRLDASREWWRVDSLLVVGYLGGMIDLLGRADEVDTLAEWVGRGLTVLETTWGRDAQAVLRIAALLAGQTADLVERGRDVTVVELPMERATAWVDELEARPDVALGPESIAWLARFRAEQSRLAAARGERPDPDALVEAYRDAVDGFAVLPNRVEHARSLARLAEALVRVGRGPESVEVTAAARAEASAMGARPVLDLLAALDPPQSRSAAPAGLTPRELEILGHLERGRTNGQIADVLFISRKTVSVHVSNILAKLGAATRGEAVSLARENGLID